MPTERLQVFIDIDGTILYDPPYGGGNDHLDMQLLCAGIEEFLEVCVENCEPYWLSYRTHQGSIDALEERLFPHLPDVARKIPAVCWDEWKSEAVDPDRPFVWSEDGLEDECEAWLSSRGLLVNYFELDRTCPDNPGLMLEHLKQRLQTR